MDQDSFQTLALELIRSVKEDVGNSRAEMMERFELVDKRFAHVERQLEQLGRQMERLQDDVREDRKKLEDVYQARSKVKITFGWQWGLVSLLIAIVASGITQVFAS